MLKSGKSFAFVHRWLGLGITFFIVLYALSGIVLNHRKALATIHIDRRLLPSDFNYVHWNNASVKGDLKLETGEILFYGDAGIWKTSPSFDRFAALMDGLPSGADQRKVEKLFQTRSGQVLAGTRYGLYLLDQSKAVWHPLPLDRHPVHIVDITQKADQIVVMGRSRVWTASEDRIHELAPMELPLPPDWTGRVPWLRMIWKLHDGSLFGWWGRVMVDLLAVALLFLCLTGVVLFSGPYWIRQRKRRTGTPALTTAALTRWSRRWHRRFGIWSVVFLLISVLSGILLRPPLLLALINRTTKPIPGTTLHPANPWKDRLRRLHYDVERDRFVLSTADGFYFFNGSLQSTPYRPACEPPASVMGVKVFEQLKPGVYLIGSFSGLYLWSPDQGAVVNWITKQRAEHQSRFPFGPHKVSGYLLDPSGREYYFDYQNGAVPIGHTASFVPMPDAMTRVPFALWNLALETHTGRFFTIFPPILRLLWVPLSGLAVLIVLISGVGWWFQIRRKKNRNRSKRVDLMNNWVDIKMCQGTERSCPHLILDPETMAQRLRLLLDEKAKDPDIAAHIKTIRFPHQKFRVAIAGCPNACSQPQIKDFGLIACVQMRTTVDTSLCTGCNQCVTVCKERAVFPDKNPAIDLSRCVGCGECALRCEPGALAVCERGWKVVAGGRLGRHPKLAEELLISSVVSEIQKSFTACLDWFFSGKIGNVRKV